MQILYGRFPIDIVGGGFSEFEANNNVVSERVFIG